MELHGCTEVPESVVDNAVGAYRFSNQASWQEKLQIRQARYADEHGAFSLTVDETAEAVECTFTVDASSHTTTIPKAPGPVTADTYTADNVVFEDVELLAVSLRADFPWTDEAFVASYWGVPNSDELDTDLAEMTRILQQYIVPRTGVVEDPPENLRMFGNYQPVDVSNYTHARTPNPWVAYSLAVVYENADLAEQLFAHDELHSPRDQYKRTPPSEMP